MAEPTSDSHSPAAPPESYGWYLEAVKWLVVIAGGSIAFGLACLEKTSDPWAYATFAISATLLVASMIVGVRYLFAGYYLAGLAEGGPSSTLAAEVQAHQKKLEAAKDRKKSYFFWLKVAFPGGMAGFAIFVTFYVHDLWEKPEPPAIVVLAPNGTDRAILRRGEKAWILTARRDGGFYWRPLRLPD
jgi:hypothetical protein